MMEDMNHHPHPCPPTPTRPSGPSPAQRRRCVSAVCFVVAVVWQEVPENRRTGDIRDHPSPVAVLGREQF